MHGLIDAFFHADGHDKIMVTSIHHDDGDGVVSCRKPLCLAGANNLFFYSRLSSGCL